MNCPYCAEEIKDEAVACCYCGRDLSVAKSLLEKTTILENQVSDLAASLDDAPQPENYSLVNNAVVTKNNWIQIILVVLLAPLFSVFYGVLFSVATIPSSMSASGIVLLIIAVVLISGPFLFAGYLVGLAWPGNHLKAYIILGLSVALIEIFNLTLLELMTGEPVGRTLHIGSGGALLLAFLGPALLFTAGGRFADLWKKIKSSKETEAGLAKKIADSIAGAGKEPSKNTVLFIQLLGPSIVTLIGTIFTGLVALSQHVSQ